MAPFSPGTGQRIFVSIANYQTPGPIPLAECVSGIWASLCAGKRHRGGEWRGLRVRDDVGFGGR
jgi:hypothetical protein